MSQTGNLVRQHERRNKRALLLWPRYSKSRNEYWLPSDLLFLKDALEARHALCRGGRLPFCLEMRTEVRKNAKQMKIPYGRVRHYSHYRLRRGA